MMSSRHLSSCPAAHILLLFISGFVLLAPSLVHGAPGTRVTFRIVDSPADVSQTACDLAAELLLKDESSLNLNGNVRAGTLNISTCSSISTSTSSSSSTASSTTMTSASPLTTSSVSSAVRTSPGVSVGAVPVALATCMFVLAMVLPTRTKTMLGELFRNKDRFALFSYLFLATCFGCYFGVFTGVDGALSKGYINCINLAPSVGFQLHWTLNGSALQAALTADISAGWMGFGVSGTSPGTMGSGGVPPGSDIALGFVDTTVCPTGCINDYSTAVYDKPVLDSVTQDATLVAGSLSGGGMEIEFTRPLAAMTSSEDREILVSGANHFIWALHDSVSPSAVDTFAKHTLRGWIDLDLSQSSSCVPPPAAGDRTGSVIIEKSLKTFDSVDFRRDLAAVLNISISRISVEAAEEVADPICPTCTIKEFKQQLYAVPVSSTTYICAAFALDKTTVDQIVAFEALPDNSQVIHHMVMYQVAPFSPAPDTSKPSNCQSQMPVGSQPIFGWAPGADPVLLPQEAGMNVGGSTNVHYVVIQFHYDNPQNLPNQIDSSGVRIYIDNAVPRTNEAGFMFLGMQSKNILIPAGEKNFHMGGECDTSGISDPINIFSWAPHMHYLGREAWLEVWDSQETTKRWEIANPYFDFNAQSFSPAVVTVSPGEILKAHCVWNSENRTGLTFGGDETSNEMCLIAVLYYPKLQTGSCYTSQYGGCNCSYLDYNCNVPACDGGATDCSAIANCTLCGEMLHCSWCSSATFNGCVAADPQVEEACETSLNGQWNVCGTAGTPCTQTHSSCTGCVADTANQCGWCQNSQTSDGLCLAQTAQAPGLCNYYGGFQVLSAGQCA